VQSLANDGKMRHLARPPGAGTIPSLDGGVLAELNSREAVIELIRATLAPIVGETMAESSPVALARKLGFDGPHLTPSQATSLIERVCLGLVVFVGRQRATAAQREIQEALAKEKPKP
jgi:hypothetical protein